MSNPTNAIEWLEDNNITIDTTLNEILESYAEYKLNEYISNDNDLSSNKLKLIKAIQLLDDITINRFSNMLLNLNKEAKLKQLY
jgi:hypothetical protein